jgi:transketolase N-terminal domain/subunit
MDLQKIRRVECLFTIPQETISRLRSLSKLSAINRIHSLSCIKSAEHGWLGACWSCCELLTFLHHACEPHDASRIILSKGHAAALQYAALYALGFIARMIDSLSLWSHSQATSCWRTRTARTAWRRMLTWSWTQARSASASAPWPAWLWQARGTR